MALGTFSLGIAEFVMMGLLPYIAKYFGASIAQAGHAISVYALGVMLGAFLLSVLRHLTLRHIMLVLASLMLAGSCLATWAPSFWTLVAARFIMGIPHGCFFGA